MKKHPLLRTAILVMMAAALLSVSALAAGDETAVNNMYGTFWALIPLSLPLRWPDHQGSLQLPVYRHHRRRTVCTEFLPHRRTGHDR